MLTRWNFRDGLARVTDIEGETETDDDPLSAVCVAGSNVMDEEVMAKDDAVVEGGSRMLAAPWPSLVWPFLHHQGSHTLTYLFNRPEPTAWKKRISSSFVRCSWPKFSSSDNFWNLSNEISSSFCSSFLFSPLVSSNLAILLRMSFILLCCTSSVNRNRNSCSTFSL